MEERAELRASLAESMSAVFGVESVNRATPLAFPTTSNFEVYGDLNLLYTASELAKLLSNAGLKGKGVQLAQVQRLLRSELETAYDAILSPSFIAVGGKGVWEYCDDRIVPNIQEILTQRTVSEGNIAARQRDEVNTGMVEQRQRITWQRKEFMRAIGTAEKFVPSVQMNLTWAIVVQAAFLNHHLVEDMKDFAESREVENGFSLPSDFSEKTYRFFEPPHVRDLSAQNQAEPKESVSNLFIRYVEAKWPTYVFALDPMNEEQNILDQYSQRRETQMALALSLASGWFKAQSVMRYARRLERDMEALSLNRTVVGFGYGESTFGWRFFPRYQTPPLESNAKALLRQTLTGPRSRESEQKTQVLNEGPRECVAIVVMPSFVTDAFIDVRSEWFPLGKRKFPQVLVKGDFLRTKGPKLTEALELSKALHEIESMKFNPHTYSGTYRNEDLRWLARSTENLADRMPIQSLTFNVPYDRSVSGMELFDWSAGALAPELQGWYGASSLDLAKGGTLFLVGRHFNTLNTNVVVNGQGAPSQLMSREVLMVSVPADLKLPKGENNVKVRVATPYGVSDAVDVPTFTSAKVANANANKSGFELSGGSPELTIRNHPSGGIIADLDVPSFSNVVLSRKPAHPNAPNRATIVFKLEGVDKDKRTFALGATAPVPVAFPPSASITTINAGPLVGAIRPVVVTKLDKRDNIVGITCKGFLNFENVGPSHHGYPVAETDNAFTIKVIDQTTR